MADLHVAELEMAWRSDIRIAFPLTAKIPHAWAVRADNSELLAAINQFWKKHYRSRDYNVIYRRYFQNTRNIRDIKAARNQEGRAGELSPFDSLIRRYAMQYKFDWRLIAAQMYQESQFDPKAKSWAGAIGLMQVMPRTGRDMGFRRLRDPESNIHAGVKYLDWIRNQLEEDLDPQERMSFALAAYNAGIGHLKDARLLAPKLQTNSDIWTGHVEQAMENLSKPQFARKARHGYVRGQEPVQYVHNIMALYQEYQRQMPAQKTEPIGAIPKFRDHGLSLPGNSVVRVANSQVSRPQ